MELINFAQLEDAHYFEISFSLNYEHLIPIIGFEGTSSLVDAFYSSFIEHTTGAINSKFPKEIFSFQKGEVLTFKSHEKEVHEFILNLIMDLNIDSEEIISYIDKEDLQVEDEQKEFFDRIIPYRVLEQLVYQKYQSEKSKWKI